MLGVSWTLDVLPVVHGEPRTTFNRQPNTSPLSEKILDQYFDLRSTAYLEAVQSLRSQQHLYSIGGSK